MKNILNIETSPPRPSKFGKISVIVEQRKGPLRLNITFIGGIHDWLSLAPYWLYVYMDILSTASVHSGGCLKYQSFRMKTMLNFKLCGADRKFDREYFKWTCGGSEVVYLVTGLSENCDKPITCG